MKVLIIGDIHGDLNQIKKISFKDIDLILLNGDIGKCDLLRKFAFKHIGKKKSWYFYEKPKDIKEAYKEVYNSYLNILKFLSKKAPVNFIFGNVEWKDYSIKKISKELKLNIPSLEKPIKKIKNISLINQRVIKFKNLKIAGLMNFIEKDWIKRFTPKDKRRLKKANKETEIAKKFLNKIGKVDILLCHQPPYKILDKVTAKSAPKFWKGKHAGSKLILEYINKKQPKYVFCGHIHESKGTKKVGKTRVYNLGNAGYKIINL